jgi:DNA-binding beta-propeller fold protein YncE
MTFVVACMGFAALPWFLTDVGGLARQGGQLTSIWGRQGASDGRFLKPRAMAIDGLDRVYVVDMTARIQVFSRDGQFHNVWKTPAYQLGKPSGLTVDVDGNLLVADTHYHRVLTYTPQGDLLDHRTLGGRAGSGPGELGFVTDMVRDEHGNLYVAEYGEHDRIQKFSRDGQFLLQWGSHGTGHMQFRRPQNLAIDHSNQVWVVDACNHRIQVFDATGKHVRLVSIWGEMGSEPGQLRFPYDLALDHSGHAYICEFGNHRVQKFDLNGKFIATWGRPGRKPGELYNPWSLAFDSRGELHVLDTGNHRVQRIRL